MPCFKPFSYLRTDAAYCGGCSIRHDAQGIRTVYLLYPYCVCGFPPQSAAIRSPIMKVISCFTYAADKVSSYWLRTVSSGIRIMCTASVLSPLTKLGCGSPPSQHSEYGYSMQTLCTQYPYSTEIRESVVGSMQRIRRWRREYGCQHRQHREYGSRVRIAGSPCIISSLPFLEITQLLPCLQKDQSGMIEAKSLKHVAVKM